MIDGTQTRDLVRWARNGDEWARAACDRLGIAWRPAPRAPEELAFERRAMLWTAAAWRDAIRATEQTRRMQ
jgi:hypothetical protein